MEVEEALFKRLSTWPAVVALVTDRVYPNEADADAAQPLIVYGKVGSEPIRDLSGAIQKQRHTVNVATEAATLAEVKAVNAAVFEALDGKAFDGVDRAYLADEATQETDNGFESLLTYAVWQ